MLATSAAFAQEVAPVAPVAEAPKAEFKVKNSAYGTIFASYAQQYVGDSLTTNAMVLERAYLGFKSEFAENWSADVKIDLAKSRIESVPKTYTVTNKDIKEPEYRPTYVKEAYVKYSKDKFSLMAGMVPTTEVGYQLKHWGNRYILNTATDISKVGVTSADIGLVAEYKINDMFSADFSIYNGEGFSTPQMDQEYTQLLGVSAKLPAGIVARAYGSFTSDTVLRKIGDANNPETIFGGLLGIKTLQDKLTVGVEYSQASNWKNVEDAKAAVSSVYGTFDVTPKIQCFLRGDMNTLEAKKDEEVKSNLYLAGAQYKFNKNVRVSCDYQQSKVEDKDALNGFYIHSEIKF